MMLYAGTCAARTEFLRAFHTFLWYHLQRELANALLFNRHNKTAQYKGILKSMGKSSLRHNNRGAVRRVFPAFFLAAACIFSACGNAGNSIPSDSSHTAEAEGPGPAVLLVTDSEIAEDSIEDRARDGIGDFLKKHPSATLEELVETDAKKAVSQASGYDAAVFVGSSFAGIGEAAGKQKDSRFIVVDTTIGNAKDEVLSLPNVCTVTFRAEEEGFLAGAAAALSPEADRVTANLDREDPDGALLEGFADGLEYASDTYGAENIDFEIADVKTDGDGVTIMDDQDQIITRIRRDPQGIVAEELEKVLAGTFRGQDLIVGVKEGCIGYISEDGKHLLTADALRKLKLTKDMIATEEPYGRIT